MKLDWRDVNANVEYPLPVVDGRYFVWMPGEGLKIAKFYVDHQRWFLEGGGMAKPSHWTYIEIEPPPQPKPAIELQLGLKFTDEDGNVWSVAKIGDDEGHDDWCCHIAEMIEGSHKGHRGCWSRASIQKLRASH